MNNRNGSAIILISMISVSVMLAVCTAIVVVRGIVISSECNSFGTIWQKSILSEYDKHLYEDYGLFAYHGSDAEVAGKIDRLMEYSLDGRLDIRTGSAACELSPYVMSDPNNFRKSLHDAMPADTLDTIINDRNRKKRIDEPIEGRVIRNRYVIDTLISMNAGGEPATSELAKEIEDNENVSKTLWQQGTEAVCEVAFARKYLDNHVTVADDREKFFSNEWEYVISGKLDDEANLKSCRVKLFLLRNAVNLASLYKDPAKVEMVTAAAEMITPGPAGVVTQAVIMEAWAALESEEDVKKLVKGDRIPLIKGEGDWLVDFGSVIGSEQVNDQLDDESKKLLGENKKEIAGLEADSIAQEVSEGQNYDDYLMLLMAFMKPDLRTRRIMDIVQIDMKMRYYRDFNWEEYYRGVSFTIKANGRDHSFEDEYE